MPSEEDLHDMFEPPAAKIILKPKVPQSHQEMAANQDVEMTQIEMSKGEDHTNLTNLIDDSYDKFQPENQEIDYELADDFASGKQQKSQNIPLIFGDRRKETTLEKEISNYLSD